MKSENIDFFLIETSSFFLPGKYFLISFERPLFGSYFIRGKSLALNSRHKLWSSPLKKSISCFPFFWCVIKLRTCDSFSSWKMYDVRVREISWAEWSGEGGRWSWWRWGELGRTAPWEWHHVLCAFRKAPGILDIFLGLGVKLGFVTEGFICLMSLSWQAIPSSKNKIFN